MRQGRDRRCGWRLLKMPETASRLLVAASIAFMTAGSMASQSPRRDCCGAYSRRNQQPTLPPENDAQPRKAILSCSEAHGMCIGDADCGGILKSVLLLCGKETVACSTPLLKPCQLAVRALADFSFYQPTCLCKEPHLDPECNVIRNFVFDHPCLASHSPALEPGTERNHGALMEDKGELLTCSEAQKGCQNEPECREHFDEFTLYCGFPWASCPREKCVTAWEQLRQSSSLVGCTCQDDDPDSASCSSIHRLINENQCLRPFDQTGLLTNDGSLDESSYSSIFTKLRPPRLTSSSARIPAIRRLGPAISSSSSNSHNTSGFVLLTTTTDIVFKVRNGNGMKEDDDDAHGTKGISMAPDGSAATAHFQYGSSTPCLEAVEMCMKLRRCKEMLEAQLRSCRKSDCDDDVCAATTQSFFALMGDASFTGDYSGVLDPKSKQGAADSDDVQRLVKNIAFCSCRHVDSRCQTMLINLAPVCVATQASLDHPSPKCHDLVRSCKEDPACRTTLATYTQKCAIDPATGRCFGEPGKCMDATSELMKSPLFRACSCSGVQFVDALVCNDWKRLLWGNPCIEQSRRKYWEEEAKRRKSPSTSSSHSSGISRSSVESHLEPHFRLSSSTGLTAAGGHGEDAWLLSKGKGKSSDDDATGNMYQSNHDGFHRVRQSDDATSTVSSVAAFGANGKQALLAAGKSPRGTSATDVREGFLLGLKDSRHPYISSGDNANNNDVDIVAKNGGGPSKKMVTPGSNNKGAVLADGSNAGFNRGRRPVSVQREQGYCVVEDAEGKSQTLYISEGETVRVYDSDRQEGCSELCNCTKDGSLSCRVLGCLKDDLCETNAARYAHLSKPLQPAYRKPCLCLYGTIVCAAPSKNDYPAVPKGLFMFIGYSMKEEKLLKGAGQVAIRDAVLRLQRMFEGLQVEQNKGDGEVYCTLVLFHQPKSGNLVLEIQTTKPLEAVPIHVQEMCTKHAKSIANMINSRDERVIRPPALSLLRLANVGPGFAGNAAGRSSSSKFSATYTVWNGTAFTSSSSAAAARPLLLSNSNEVPVNYVYAAWCVFLVLGANIINGLLFADRSCVRHRQDRCGAMKSLSSAHSGSVGNQQASLPAASALATPSSPGSLEDESYSSSGLPLNNNKVLRAGTSGSSSPG